MYQSVCVRAATAGSEITNRILGQSRNRVVKVTDIFWFEKANGF